MTTARARSQLPVGRSQGCRGCAIRLSQIRAAGTRVGRADEPAAAVRSRLARSARAKLFDNRSRGACKGSNSGSNSSKCVLIVSNNKNFLIILLHDNVMRFYFGSFQEGTLYFEQVTEVCIVFVTIFFSIDVMYS